MTLGGWQFPSCWAEILLAVLSRVVLHSMAAEGFLLHLGWNEALTTQEQICYLESYTSLSVTRAVVPNTLQLVFEWVKRGVANLRPRNHRQGTNGSNPCPWHGCPMPAVLTSQGWQGTRQQERCSQRLTAVPDPAPCAASAPQRPETLGCKPGPPPTCSSHPVACCLFGIWLFRP